MMRLFVDANRMFPHESNSSMFYSDDLGQEYKAMTTISRNETGQFNNRLCMLLEVLDHHREEESVDKMKITILG